MTIEYSSERRITTDQFREILVASRLGERRPIDDAACLRDMLANANLLCTAWAGDALVGVARSITDHVYACYLSDLAVGEGFQHRGIGTELVRRTRGALGPRCALILLSAPDATRFYPKIGFAPHPSAWTLPPGSPVIGE